MKKMYTIRLYTLPGKKEVSDNQELAHSEPKTCPRTKVG